ncbi:transporter substrate-binding domain-containing protein [Nocardia sp. NPDC127579]|uniref:transporter substrate-binding domain-containing protein n=1 Tax=Nocardia sp. NPDC127579 TaxID=3345402 RepID=UPI003637C175
MKRSLLAVMLAAGLLPIACARTEVAAPEYVVGIAYDRPGLSVLENGQPRGFDVEVARYIAARLGTAPGEITWVEVPAGQQDELLRGGAVDFVVGSYAGNEVGFAGPYFVAGQDLLVRADETGIGRPEDLGERAVCVVAGSAAERIIRDFAAGANLTARVEYSACVADLLARRVDAVTADDLVLAGYAAQAPDALRVVGHPFTREHYGVAVRKGDTDLQVEITTAIRAMIDDGAWERAAAAHLVPTGYTPPPIFTATGDHTPPTDPDHLDPALVDTVDQLTAAANTRQWETFDSMVCPEAATAVSTFVLRYTPQYDDHHGPELIGAGYQHTTTAITQQSPDSARYRARETFTDIPAKYRHYFKPLDYTATMTRRDGAWQLCGLAADFATP